MRRLSALYRVILSDIYYTILFDIMEELVPKKKRNEL